MVRARIKVGEDGVKVVECIDRQFCSALEDDGYLQGDNMDPLEAAYQCASGNIGSDNSSGWGCALEIITASRIWIPIFIVYYDLRRRGRKPKRGVRGNTLWVSMGSKRVEFLVVEEGGRLSFGQIGVWSRLAVGDGFTPVIAIVDRVGGVTYYEARVVEGIS